MKQQIYEKKNAQDAKKVVARQRTFPNSSLWKIDGVNLSRLCGLGTDRRLHEIEALNWQSFKIIMILIEDECKDSAPF